VSYLFFSDGRIFVVENLSYHFMKTASFGILNSLKID